VKPDDKVAVLGIRDQAFLRDLRTRAPDVSFRRRSNCDVIFLAVEGPEDLPKIAELKGSITRGGSIWVVHPKGRPDFKQSAVIEAIVAAGLVDNKGIRFSDTHAALRAVFRLRDR